MFWQFINLESKVFASERIFFYKKMFLTDLMAEMLEYREEK